MPLTEKELLERDAKRNIGEELLAAIVDVKAGRRGAVHRVELTEAAEARSKTGLSQPKFAELLGVSVRTLQEWEQGRCALTAAYRRPASRRVPGRTFKLSAHRAEMRKLLR